MSWVPAELHDVPHDEEVAGEAELLDHVQLVVDLGPGPGMAGRVAGPVAPDGALLGQVPQPAHLGVAGGGRPRRQVGRHQGQVEGAVPAQLGGPLDHAGVAGEAAGLFGPAAQVGRGRGRQPAVDVVQAAPGPHRGQGGGQPAAGRGGGSGRCWWRRSRRRRGRRGRPGRRCGPSRAGRRGPTAPPPRWSGRTGSAGGPARPAARAGPWATRAAGTIPLRQPVSTTQWSGAEPGAG